MYWSPPAAAAPSMPILDQGHASDSLAWPSTGQPYACADAPVSAALASGSVSKSWHQAVPTKFSNWPFVKCQTTSRFIIISK